MIDFDGNLLIIFPFFASIMTKKQSRFSLNYTATILLPSDEIDGE